MKTSAETLLKIAQKTIQIEAKTLIDLAESLDDTSDFVQAVEAIFSSKGRVVVTGIGKSAIVAQKIVATLNSTGTPSYFMHAADAIHGDLGIIQDDDIVICLSKSGETPEISVLLPILKFRGNILIAVTSNREATLAKMADFVLWTPVELEADPNRLAPTSSTTAQMAMGDALAVALISMRGFSVEDFARVHPGGALGKQLYLRVKDLALKNQKPFVSQHADLQKVIIEISSKRLGVTAVLDENERLVGIITDGDLRRMLEQSTQLAGITAAQIMTRQPKTIQSEALATEALFTLRKYAVSQLIVTENEQYFGVIHLHDLIREGIV